MMMNKRLIHTVSESKKYIGGNVLLQWCSLLANVAIMAQVAGLLQKLYERQAQARDGVVTIVLFAAVIVVRSLCEMGAVRMSYLASGAVKRTLREKIYAKLLKLGPAYHQNMASSEIVQVSVEGVDQLETYFGAYLPQFFFSLLAPLTLFAFLLPVSPLVAVLLLICVPLIPITIAVIQTWAKKLLSKYWGQYTALGDTFLENLQGLTTLKIYQTDEWKHQEMNEQSEQFRRITMKVLTMQLNSITIMDLVTYGGTALGMILAVLQLQAGKISLSGCLMFLLLSADFFIPMRRLGSYFHIAMNGMAASDKIFRLLDLPEPEGCTLNISEDKTIRMERVHFSYPQAFETEKRVILQDICLEAKQGSFLALVGESGCGKSTIAGILAGNNRGYQGSITIGGLELSRIQPESLWENITLINHNSYLFKGTVRENLLMGKPDATDAECIQALRKVQLYDFLEQEQGLDTLLLEKASNLSGGQCQRLALARALLHDTPIYIFDEAASNVDVESEEAIMEQIKALAKEKTVLLISHRLANVNTADQILVLQQGVIAERGTHQELLQCKGSYAQMFHRQMELEQYSGGCHEKRTQ